jgi:excinuclease ABC subunit C
MSPRKRRAAAPSAPSEAADPAGAPLPAAAPEPAPSTATPGLLAQLPADGSAGGDGTTAQEPTISLPLQELIERIPKEPGVYLMKDKKGRIIYVGKATNLRQRVRSYFNRSGDSRAFVKLLNRLLGDIETMVVSNEKEALLLENTLIKQHKPRFNVKLVDDKNYLVLRLDPKARYPRLEVTRRIRDDSARYFGPYHSATSCRQTLRVVNRHFKLRTCTDQVLNSRKRPCLQYQIKRCDAPCVFPIPAEQYAEQVRDVGLFLDRKDDELIERLRDRMLKASDDLEFERAAAIRDQLHALSQTLEEQHAVSAQFVDQDIFGYHREGDVLEIAVLFVRQGRLLGRRSYRFTGQEFPDEESISSFVGLYYDRGAVIPDEVLLPIEIEDQEAKAEWLRERAEQSGGRRRKVVVLHPQRGPRAKLVELANKNAAVSYVSRRDKTRDTEEALAKLQHRLGLKQLPRRIECFDISHLQGTYTVASRVVFLDGEPARHLYRSFRVRSAANDDFASMYEVLSRRFRRALQAGTGTAATVERKPEAPSAANEPTALSPATIAARRAAALLPERRPVASPAMAADAAPAADALADSELDEQDQEAGAAPGDTDAWAMPDLLVIDGGKGQLATALAALKDVGVNWAAELDVIGLAKERETGEAAEGDKVEKVPDRVFLPRTKDPIKLRPNTAEMFVLSRIRDEAHRFAVTFHQKLRERRTIRSQLADIPGVGPKRQSALLKTLGSVRRIRTATVEELAAVPGMTLRAAQAIVDFYQSGTAPPPTADAPPPSITAPPAAPAPPPPNEDIIEDAAAQELAALDDKEAGPAAAPSDATAAEPAGDGMEDLAAQVAALAQATAAQPAEPEPA